MLKISIILGTRPEIIKMSPIIKKLECLRLNYFILHTGQHYSYNMDKVFFDQLKLPEPSYNLGIRSGTQAEEVGKMLMGVETILQKERVEIVLVEGDTNSVLAGALAAAKLGIKVGHVEAGLRSYDKEMPEEINRVLTDHLSDYLFAPTENSRQNLLKEGIDEEKIVVTGNTIVDAVYQNSKLSEGNNVLEELGLEEDDYFLVTIHRQENVDNKERFHGILKGLESIGEEFEKPVIYPIHPRSRKMLNELSINVSGIRFMNPFDYLSFLHLESRAKVILTDSGGIQEEACILGVPCVTLRDNTERPETLEIGANVLAGTSSVEIVEKVRSILNKKHDWKHPFGDGKAAMRIVNELIRK